ncbi:MAG TPA: helix-turn-helix domain-containing protein [Rhizomicrobium sp.]|nr:helix-turn-helix domain-containing protein [Rhizomicrobium sp.]
MSESAPEKPDMPPGAVLNFSSATLPDRDRIPIFREFLGRKLMRVEIEPLAGHAFEADVAVRKWPGLDFISARRSPLKVGRTKGLLSDGDDRLVFQFDDFPSVISHARGEVALDAGDAILTSNGDAVYRTFPSSGVLASLFLHRSALGPLLRDGESGIGRAIPAQTPVLRLIRSVLTTLKEEAALATPELQALTVNYVYDLVALAIGATRDAAELAKGRGVRAAQLRSIKAYCERHVSRGDLSPDALAPRFGMSARSIQRLFETEGITFTEFLRELRLKRVHRMLSSPRFDAMTVTDIAFACGFGELSHFNRHFRARFGASPRDVRKARRQ